MYTFSGLGLGFAFCVLPGRRGGQRERETTDSKTDRQTERKTDRQAGRQTDRTKQSGCTNIIFVVN